MFIYGIYGRQWVEMPDGGGNDGGGDKDAAFQRLLDRYKNDAMALAEKLFSENFTHRGQIRQLEQQLTEARGKAPAEGAVVLAPADAAVWAAYQALGKPGELKQGLEERTQLQGKLTGMERDTLLRSVADVVGYKPSVLANLERIARSEGKTLGFEVKDQTVEGKPVRVAYVKDGDAQTPLADYAQTHWADFMPALVAQSTQGGGAPPPTGVRYPAQHAGGGAGGKTDLVNDFLQKQEASRAAAKNPLLKE